VHRKEGLGRAEENPAGYICERAGWGIDKKHLDFFNIQAVRGRCW